MRNGDEESNNKSTKQKPLRRHVCRFFFLKKKEKIQNHKRFSNNHLNFEIDFTNSNSKIVILKLID